MNLNPEMQEGESLAQYVNRLTEAAEQIESRQAALEELERHLAYSRACKVRLDHLTGAAQQGKPRNRTPRPKAPGTFAEKTQAILEAVQRNPGKTPKELSLLLPDVAYGTITSTLGALSQGGHVVKDEYGRYGVPQAQPEVMVIQAAQPEPTPAAPRPMTPPNHILSVLEDEPNAPMTEREIMEATGMKSLAVKSHLNRLMDEGLVREVQEGVWELA